MRRLHLESPRRRRLWKGKAGKQEDTLNSNPYTINHTLSVIMLTAHPVLWFRGSGFVRLQTEYGFGHQVRHVLGFRFQVSGYAAGNPRLRQLQGRSNMLARPYDR